MRLPNGWIAIPKIDRKGVQVTVEIKELITCEECKYFFDKLEWCMNGNVRDMCSGDDATTFCPEMDFFCKYGERRESK